MYFAEVESIHIYISSIYYSIEHTKNSIYTDISVNKSRKAHYLLNLYCIIKCKI